VKIVSVVVGIPRKSHLWRVKKCHIWREKLAGKQKVGGVFNAQERNIEKSTGGGDVDEKADRKTWYRFSEVCGLISVGRERICFVADHKVSCVNNMF